jgi:hypothetical protein
MYLPYFLICVFYCEFYETIQLKDEYKEEFATGMALFGGPDGFDAWMKINTHPTCTKKVY